MGVQRFRWKPTRRMHVAIGVPGLFFGPVLLSGCLSDPPPDPEVQPLEIVVGNPDPAVGPCVLNVDEVGAGTHDVAVVVMGDGADVRILDSSGGVVFTHAAEDHAAEGGASVRLQEGRYVVECALVDGTSSTSLRVVAAQLEP